jgi:hypothetical protein
MGQDTYCDIGYGVTLVISLDNIELIKNAFLCNEVNTYFSNNDYDEALLTEDYELEKFEKELNKRIGEEIYFFRSALCVDARNLSRRDLPRLFGDCCIGLESLNEKLEEGKSKFLEVGFNEEDIRLKYMFEDSY